MGQRNPYFVRLFLLLLLGTGCGASRQYFAPTERVRGHTMQGYPEAVYELVGARSRFGEAKLWSRGAYKGPEGNTVIQVSIEIHNTSAQPIVLSSTEFRLRPVRTDEGSFDDLEPAEHTSVAIVPGSIRELRFHFVLPKKISPGDVSAFRVHWQVMNGDQGYGQRTPFVEEYRRRYARAGIGLHYAYCDPFDPFCYGYGYPYPYGYPYYGYGPVYGGVIVTSPARGGERVIVRPGR